ncbi:flagellar protein FlgN [Bacillus massilinigeriensis]|uniref:flagellar protein FlgN n=1 Tax=Bacillus massilionigeriensis TaxID=1805475 RepID=UPI00096B3F88|nr:flagellar protein FlgN [Bacillus massilionigeriensis]
MSAESLIASTEKLFKLHKSLYEIAVKKTEVIKKGDIDTLNQILKDEQTHIAAITKVEKERQQAACALVPEQENPSVTDCFERISEIEQFRLAEIANKLSELVFELKEQNFLNQQLIHQSLQFVNVSMNLLNPQPDSINYGPPAGSKKQSKNTQGMFNSRV